jgi:hypothetical protein
LAQLGRSRRVERLVHHSRDCHAEDGHCHSSAILPSDPVFDLDMQYEFLRAREGQLGRLEAQSSTHVEGSRRSDQTSAHGEVDNVPDDVREPMAADGVAELAREGVEVDLAERRELSDRRATRALQGKQRTALKRKEIVSPKTARANSLQGNARRLAPARRRQLSEGRREASMRLRDRS